MPTKGLLASRDGPLVSCLARLDTGVHIPAGKGRSDTDVDGCRWRAVREQGPESIGQVARSKVLVGRGELAQCPPSDGVKALVGGARGWTRFEGRDPGKVDPLGLVERLTPERADM